jgi:hypothetical protein
MSEPIQAKHRGPMNVIMEVLDKQFPGMSITLLIADFNTPADAAAGREPRLNYISNSDRADMLAAMREFIAHTEGSHHHGTGTTQ